MPREHFEMQLYVCSRKDRGRRSESSRGGGGEEGVLQEIEREGERLRGG